MSLRLGLSRSVERDQKENELRGGGVGAEVEGEKSPWCRFGSQWFVLEYSRVPLGSTPSRCRRPRLWV